MFLGSLNSFTLPSQVSVRCDTSPVLHYSASIFMKFLQKFKFNVNNIISLCCYMLRETVF